MRKKGRDILHLPNAVLLLQPKARAGQKTTGIPEDGHIFLRTWRLAEPWQRVLAGLHFS